MVLRYWGARGLDAESFAPLVDRSAGGIRTTRLIDDLRQRGWNAAAVEGRDDLIDAELARGRPVLTLIEDRPGTFHYVVIVASTPEAIVFHDPARAPFRVMERQRFARRWSPADRWMAVVTPSETVSFVGATGHCRRGRRLLVQGAHRRRCAARAGRRVRGGRTEPDRGLVVRRGRALSRACRSASVAATMARGRRALVGGSGDRSDGCVRVAVARHQPFCSERSCRCTRGVEPNRAATCGPRGCRRSHAHEAACRRTVARRPSAGPAHAQALRFQCTTPEGIAVGEWHAARVRSASRPRGAAGARHRAIARPGRSMELCRTRSRGPRTKRGRSVDGFADRRWRAGQRRLAILARQAEGQSRGHGPRSMGWSVGRRWFRGAPAIFREHVSDISSCRHWRDPVQLGQLVDASVGACGTRCMGWPWNVRRGGRRTSPRVSARSRDCRCRWVRLAGAGSVRDAGGLGAIALEP